MTFFKALQTERRKELFLNQSCKSNSCKRAASAIGIKEPAHTYSSTHSLKHTYSITYILKHTLTQADTYSITHSLNTHTKSHTYSSTHSLRHTHT
uniref:Uncharacterized protein n=1 Tax=Octopus bimaculoides TaxID=37653 RepID=A0A0L8HPH6_OCTBM